MQRDNKQDIIGCCRSFNVCPICRLPLMVSRDFQIDIEWRRSVSLFRSYPSSMRRIQPIGTATLRKHEFDIDAYDRAHIFHRFISEQQATKSIFNVNANLVNGWFVFSLDELFLMTNTDVERLGITKDQFYGKCKKNLSVVSDLDLNSLFPVLNLQASKLLELTGPLFSYTFTTCKECNSMMTNNDYFTRLFDTINWGKRQAMLGDVGSKKSRRSSQGVLVVEPNNVDHLNKLNDRNSLDGLKCLFFLIQSVVPPDSILENAIIRIPSHITDVSLFRATWGFHACIVYFGMMILFSIWKHNDFLSSEGSLLRSRVTLNICDIYCSFFLYFLYIANTSNSESYMTFELFHYVYFSNLTQYFGAQLPLNFIRFLFVDLSTFQSRFSNVATFKTQISIILTGLSNFYNTGFHQLLQNKFHSNDRFFYNFSECQNKFREIETMITSNIDEVRSCTYFCNILGVNQYWRPFLTYEMPNIYEMILDFLNKCSTDDNHYYRTEWVLWWFRFSNQIRRVTSMQPE